MVCCSISWKLQVKKHFATHPDSITSLDPKAYQYDTSTWHETEGPQIMNPYKLHTSRIGIDGLYCHDAWFDLKQNSANLKIQLTTSTQQPHHWLQPPKDILLGKPKNNESISVNKCRNFPFSTKRGDDVYLPNLRFPKKDPTPPITYPHGGPLRLVHRLKSDPCRHTRSCRRHLRKKADGRTQRCWRTLYIPPFSRIDVPLEKGASKIVGEAYKSNNLLKNRAGGQEGEWMKVMIVAVAVHSCRMLVTFLGTGIA